MRYNLKAKVESALAYILLLMESHLVDSCHCNTQRHKPEGYPARSIKNIKAPFRRQGKKKKSSVEMLADKQRTQSGN